ncbi:DUF4288 domain-containing protein [Zooshikella harenae]|uniref:DUF4288 domain-containing protein n=1 Tax=Zooshikella harenae TaxID=2827238 RepID=A0ABS5ZI10_9GAMM|nr:DUF4288 domain-containing protein [Zooshikella harenae]MBU2713711.1 DUF4288 domain-containing protein [Zooshikella harenae]
MWYAARSVYFFGVKDNGKNIFEERIVCIEADDFTSAHAKAETESEVYSKENGFVAHPEQYIYKQDGEKLLDGYELWSELFESDFELETFYNNRYTQYLYDETT